MHPMPPPLPPPSPATQVRTFHLEAPPGRVFPLFTAEGEKVWAPGWEPRVLSGAEERGSAFVTKSHDGQTVTWIVTDYRPREWRVSYARLVVGMRFAALEAGLAQFIYLVLFSYAFFFKGFTGLAITIGSIVTLFVVMQMTGKIRWEHTFARARVAANA